MQNAKFRHLTYFQNQEPKISCDLHLAFCQTIVNYGQTKSHASCCTSHITFWVLVFQRPAPYGGYVIGHEKDACAIYIVVKMRWNTVFITAVCVIKQR